MEVVADEVVVVVLMGVICFFLADEELRLFLSAVVEPLLDNFCTVSCLNENDLILLICAKATCNDS